MPYFWPCYNSTMTRKRVVKLSVLFLVLFIVAPSVAMAAGVIPTIVPDTCRGQGGCQSVCDIAQVAQNILNAAIYLAVFLSAVLFAWAGFLYLTNVANSGQHTRAVEVFKNVAI